MKKREYIDVICCDADGVVIDLDKYQKWAFNDYYTKIGQPVPEIINPEAYDPSDIYGISKELRFKIMSQYFPHYCQVARPRKDFLEMLRAFQLNGKKVNMVTARAMALDPKMGTTIQFWFGQWLYAFGDFVPDEIIFCSEENSGLEKAEACLKLIGNKGGIMYEDKPDNFDYLLDVCTTIGIRQPWNNGYIPPENAKYSYYLAKDSMETFLITNEIDKGVRRK